MKKKVKLNARIDLGIDIKLPDKSVPLSVITPDGMLSEEAIVEIEDDLVNIQFSTALGKVGLTISPSDLEKVLQATKQDRSIECWRNNGPPWPFQNSFT